MVQFENVLSSALRHSFRPVFKNIVAGGGLLMHLPLKTSEAVGRQNSRF